MMIWAIVKFSFEGFHKWSKAPRGSILRNLHRHIFHCEVWVSQSAIDNSREVEYLELKGALDKIKFSFLNNSNDSCETIAENIRSWVEKEYPGRKTKVFVFEDNENGCCLE
jgi:hypothetical protein